MTNSPSFGRPVDARASHPSESGSKSPSISSSPEADPSSAALAHAASAFVLMDGNEASSTLELLTLSPMATLETSSLTRLSDTDEDCASLSSSPAQPARRNDDGKPTATVGSVVCNAAGVCDEGSHSADPEGHSTSDNPMDEESDGMVVVERFLYLGQAAKAVASPNSGGRNVTLPSAETPDHGGGSSAGTIMSGKQQSREDENGEETRTLSPFSSESDTTRTAMGDFRSLYSDWQATVENQIPRPGHGSPISEMKSPSPGAGPQSPSSRTGPESPCSVDADADRDEQRLLGELPCLEYFTQPLSDDRPHAGAVTGKRDVGASVPAALICGLCCQYLNAPCTLFGCGHTYCLACILNHADRVHRGAVKDVLTEPMASGETLSTGSGIGGPVVHPPGSATLESLSSGTRLLPRPGEPSRTSPVASQGRYGDPTTVSAAADATRQPAPCPHPGCGVLFRRAACRKNTALADVAETWCVRNARFAAHVDRARWLVRRRQYGEAVRHYWMALIEDGYNAMALCELSTCFIHTDCAKEALVAAERACWLEPNGKEPYLHRAAALMLQGDDVRAAADIWTSVRGEDEPEKRAHCLASELLCWRQKHTSLTEGRCNQNSMSPDDVLAPKEFCTLAPLTAAREDIGEISLAAEKPNVQDINCPVCFRLVYQPVTTPCGHVCCLPCLVQVMDRRVECPSCRGSLQPMLEVSEQTSSGLPITVCLVDLLKTYMSERYQQRDREHQAELLVKNILPLGPNVFTVPIFRWRVVFPHVVYPLYVFEPRYRLLVRRALSCGTRQFGGCGVDRSVQAPSCPHYSYGTMLNIQEVNRCFTDGRKVLSCVGTRRFRCVNQGPQLEQDGYDRANVEWIVDRKPSLEEMEDLQDYHDDTQGLARQLLRNPKIARWPMIHLLAGLQGAVMADVPSSDLLTEDGPAWVWHCASVLPYDHEESGLLEVLASRSLRERLVILHRYLSRELVASHFLATLMYRYEMQTTSPLQTYFL